MKKIATFALLFLAMGGQAQAAGLLGKRIATRYIYPSENASLYYPDAVVTIDGQTPINIEGNFTQNFLMIFTDAGLDISFVRNSFWKPDAFNGFKIWDVDGTLGDFTASIASSTMAGLSASNIRYDQNTIWVNWQGLSFDTATRVSFDITAAAVPEPATWALMLTGLGLTSLSLRRRARGAGVLA